MQSVRSAQPPDSSTQDRSNAAIEGLTVALARFRRGAAALRAENDDLRGELSALSSARITAGPEVAAGTLGELGTVAIPAGIMAPGAARLVVDHCLRGLVAPRVLEDARLVVTELVTNRLLHADLRESDAVCVRVCVAGQAIRIEVENPGTVGTLAANGSDPQAGRGFGLEIMQRLAVQWGVRRHGSTCVWVDMERV